MKHIIFTTVITTVLLLSSPAVQAGWFTPDPVPEYREKIVSLEHQMSAQGHTLNLWQIAAGSLGIGCVLLLIIGTALGAQTRKHHHYGTAPLGSGRMGAPHATTGLNGRQPGFMGEAAQEDDHTTLAA